MNIDVANSIGELLFQNKSVIVPGFGGFTSDYKSASIEYVQGAVNPPSKSLEFNDNLKVNDGLLLNFLQRRHDISVEEAQSSIDSFVKDMQQTLKNKEIVELPKVGRLYLDYENKMKFLPEGTNFNTTSFGLPKVTANPIHRKKVAAAAAGATVTTAGATTSSVGVNSAPSYQKKDYKGNWLTSSLWWLILLALAVILFSIFLIIKNPSPEENIANTEQIDENRINTSPTEDEKVKDDPEDLEDFAMDEDELNYEDEEFDEPEIDTEGESTLPSLQEAFIIIHSFGVKKNAENFSNQLIEEGHNASSVRDGSLYRVGINFTYEEENELTELLKELKSEYKSTPVVWEGGKGKAN